MSNIKKRFVNICQEYGIVGASLEIYKNNKTKSLFYGKASDKNKTRIKVVIDQMISTNLCAIFIIDLLFNNKSILARYIIQVKF